MALSEKYGKSCSKFGFMFSVRINQEYGWDEYSNYSNNSNCFSIRIIRIQPLTILLLFADNSNTMNIRIGRIPQCKVEAYQHRKIKLLTIILL